VRERWWWWKVDKWTVDLWIGTGAGIDRTQRTVITSNDRSTPYADRILLAAIELTSIIRHLWRISTVVNCACTLPFLLQFGWQLRSIRKKRTRNPGRLYYSDLPHTTSSRKLERARFLPRKTFDRVWVLCIREIQSEKIDTWFRNNRTQNREKIKLLMLTNSLQNLQN